jgi:hypothetical protein
MKEERDNRGRLVKFDSLMSLVTWDYDDESDSLIRTQKSKKQDYIIKSHWKSNKMLKCEEWHNKEYKQIYPPN